jgi:hypothetical protein
MGWTPRTSRSWYEVTVTSNNNGQDFASVLWCIAGAEGSILCGVTPPIGGMTCTKTGLDAVAMTLLLTM